MKLGSRALTLVLALALSLPITPVRLEAAPPDVEKASLLLSRATFGPKPSDLDSISASSVDAWLEAQLHPERIDDSRLLGALDKFPDLKLSTKELMDKYPRPTREEREARQKARETEAGMAPPREEMRREGPARIVAQLAEAKLLRATGSERQLEEVLVDFWFNHFNVYARKNLPTLLSLPSFERDAIRPHVMGKFHDLLLATAQHPAMLHYLDNAASTKEGYDPRQALRAMRDRAFEGGGRARGRMGGFRERPRNRRPEQERRKFGINENYARELLELHTLGVDGGYTQKDVVEVARALTGWTVTTPEMVMERLRRGEGMTGSAAPKRFANAGPPEDGRFHFNAAAHDEDPKTVLGRRIDSGGVEDGLEVIRILSAHPSTAAFISTKLAKRFVSDHPSPELVKEMSSVFLGTGGDIREVLRTMFASPRFVEEGRAATKIKTPFELVVSTLRATSAEVRGPALARTLEGLGMPLYLCQPPTGYDEEAETWLSAGNMLSRIRFTAELLSGRVRGVSPVTPPSDVSAWARKILPHHAPLSPQDEATLGEALSGFPEITQSESLQKVALVLTSPAFQRQ